MIHVTHAVDLGSTLLSRNVPQHTPIAHVVTPFSIARCSEKKTTRQPSLQAHTFEGKILFNIPSSSGRTEFELAPRCVYHSTYFFTLDSIISYTDNHQNNVIRECLLGITSGNLCSTSAYGCASLVVQSTSRAYAWKRNALQSKYYKI